MGIIYGFTAAISMAVMTLLVNSSRSDFSLGQIVFARSFVMCIFTLPFALGHLSLIKTKISRLLLVRSVLGAAASITYLRTLQLGHLGLANSLAVVTQVIVPVGAFIFLREKLGKIQIMGLILIIFSFS